MDMASSTYLQHLAGLVEDGTLQLEVIDASVRPILAIKVRMGLFEQPYVDETKLEQVVALPEHRRKRGWLHSARWYCYGTKASSCRSQRT